METSKLTVKNSACTSTKEVFPGLMLLKFKSGHFFGQLISEDDDTFFLVIKYQSLHLKWSIVNILNDEENIITWVSITLEECNENVSGNYIIEGSGGHIKKGEFDNNSVSQKLVLESPNITCDKNHQFITVEMNIYRKVCPSFKGFQSYLENKHLSDVKFIIKGEEVTAHKLIMSARSDYFAKMFESDMLEKNSGQVVIEDVELKTFKLLLNFIYCGNFECDDVDDLLKLLVTADKYSLKNLIVMCSDRITVKLSEENVVEVLKVADLLGVNFLKNNCLDYILECKYSVAETEAYKEMVNSGRADLVSELFLR